MLGTTLSIYIGGTGGTEKVLNRISDDGLSAKYFLREDGQEFTLDVWHNIDKNDVAKHYCELRKHVYATSTVPAYDIIASFNFKAINALSTNGAQKELTAALCAFMGATTATAGRVDGLIGLNS